MQREKSLSYCKKIVFTRLHGVTYAILVFQVNKWAFYPEHSLRPKSAIHRRVVYGGLFLRTSK